MRSISNALKLFNRSLVSRHRLVSNRFFFYIFPARMNESSLNHRFPRYLEKLACVTTTTTSMPTRIFAVFPSADSMTSTDEIEVAHIQLVLILSMGGSPVKRRRNSDNPSAVGEKLL